MSILPPKRKPFLMPNAEIAMTKRAFGQTMRADVWWIQPLLVFVGLSTFIIYSTWAAFQGKDYFFGNYISPFIRRNCLAIRPIVGFDRHRAGVPSGFYFRPRFLFFVRRVASGSPVT